MSKYKSIGLRTFNIDDVYSKVTDDVSLTQPEAALTIQELMSNVIEYQRQYREGSYIDDEVTDVQAFGLVNVDGMDLAELQELRDHINDKVKGRFIADKGR